MSTKNLSQVITEAIEKEIELRESFYALGFMPKTIRLSTRMTLETGARIALSATSTHTGEADEQIQNAESAIATLTKLFPPDKHGEDPDVCEIYDCIKGMRDYIQSIRPAHTGENEVLEKMRAALIELKEYVEQNDADFLNRIGQDHIIDNANSALAVYTQSKQK